MVGAGRVGSTFAYAALLSGLTSEIVLVDEDRARAEGEAMDLSHAVALTPPARVWAGSYADCAGAAVTVVAAGAGQKPGETRLALLGRNGAIVDEVAEQMATHNPDGILLIATNPVDVLSYRAWQRSGLPAGRVLGSGTILDTARFRYLLGEHYALDPHSVHAHILGEHGDSEVPAWSLATVAGMPLTRFCAVQGLSCEIEDMENIFRQTRDAAYSVIQRKGATHYAIGAGLLRICRAILRDERSVLTVSTLVSGYYDIDDVYLSLPVVVGRNGVERCLRPDLSALEVDQLRHSSDVLKQHISSLAPGRTAG